MSIRLRVQIIGFLAGDPFIFLMAKSNAILVVYAAMFLFGIFRGMYDSNRFAALYDVVKEKYHSTATGLSSDTFIERN